MATADGGFIAIQAKTTVSPSMNAESPYRQTVSQFVRHWLASRDGDGRLGWNRPMNPAHDRLVLAVGPHTPRSIRIDLPNALRLVGQPGGGILNQAQQRAFTYFEAAATEAWHQTTRAPFDPSILPDLARLVGVFTFDPDGVDRPLMAARLIDVFGGASEASTGVELLQAISADFAAKRGGVDINVLRQALNARGAALPDPYL